MCRPESCRRFDDLYFLAYYAVLKAIPSFIRPALPGIPSYRLALC